VQAPSAPALVLVALAPLLAWRAYARFRRLVGRQKLSRIRPWITLAVFPALLALLAFAAWPDPGKLALLACGAGGGALLGRFGLSRTRFEATPQGLFYTPNAHLGIALSALFLARIVYRVAEVFLAPPELPHGVGDFARSPLTLGVFGLLAGYYVAYAIGLVRWRRSELRNVGGGRAG